MSAETGQKKAVELEATTANAGTSESGENAAERDERCVRGAHHFVEHRLERPKGKRHDHQIWRCKREGCSTEKAAYCPKCSPVKDDYNWRHDYMRANAAWQSRKFKAERGGRRRK